MNPLTKKAGRKIATEHAETTEKPKKQTFSLWSLRTLWFNKIAVVFYWMLDGLFLLSWQTGGFPHLGESLMFTGLILNAVGERNVYSAACCR